MMDQSPRPAKKVYLNPGELVVAQGPALVTTVLGSCVAVALFVPDRAYGAICHAVLPAGSGNDPGKYVDQAVRYMVGFFGDLRVEPRDLVAKVFGGADLFSQADGGGSICSIGSQNIQSAYASLSRAGLEPVAADVGGQQGRKLVYSTHTGEVLLKRISQVLPPLVGCKAAFRSAGDNNFLPLVQP